MILEELTSVLGLHINEAQWKAGERAVDGMKEGLSSLGEKSGLSGIIKAGLASFVGYEAINGVKEMISSVVELGSQLNDTAQKTGLSVEALQFYGYVAKLNSSNTEELAGATEKLAHTLNDVKDAANPAAIALKDMGIKFNDPTFKAANMDTKFKLIAEHLAKMPDGAKKTADAIALFGRSGAQLIPTLNDLGKNGAQLRGEFEELGGGLSGENVKALDDFGDSVDKTKYGLTALKNGIIVELLPTLKDMLASVQTWIKANKQLIAQKVERALFLVADAVKLIGRAALFLIDALGWISDHAVALAPIFGMLLAFFAPWETAIAAVVIVVKAFIDAFTEGKGPLAGFAKWFMDLIHEIKKELGVLKDVATGVWDVISFIPKKIAGAGGAIKDFFGSGDSSQGTTTAQIFSGQGFQPQTPTAKADPGDLYAGSQAGRTTYNTPISVSVNGGDPAQVKQAVKEAVTEAQKDMLRQAMDSVKGGAK